MDRLGDIPSPFLFNTIKHHNGFQLDFIEEVKKRSFGIEELSNRLLNIGNSMIDLYFGTMSPRKIVQEVEKQLRPTNSFHENDYYSFINQTEKKFQTITLSDQSSWTLLIGRVEGRYIHIHPSRGSLHTMRIRAMALKTAILLSIIYEKELLKGDLVKLVNETRSMYMKESPIKNELYTKALKRVLKLFT